MVDVGELKEALGLTDIPAMPARYNMAPSQSLPIVRKSGRLELVRWGLPTPHGLGVNVRIETVARAPAYRASFSRRRCLVVVDGFYEWRAHGKAKQPFRIRRPDGKPFALAGIWQRTTTMIRGASRPSDRERLIVTVRPTPANTVVTT